MRVVNPNQVKQLLAQLENIRKHVESNQGVFSQIKLSLVLTKLGGSSDLGVMLTNPEFDEDADYQDTVLAIEELIGLMNEKPQSE